MKNLKRIGLIILSTIALAGCMTRNPNYNAAAPATDFPGTNAPYVPATSKFDAYLATAKTANAATAPADPYAPLIATGLEILGTIVTGGSLLLANAKNKQAQTHKAAAQTLATALPDSLVQKAIESAPTPAIAAAVAAHLQAAPSTGA